MTSIHLCMIFGLPTYLTIQLRQLCEVYAYSSAYVLSARVLSFNQARLHLVIGRPLVDLGGPVDLLGQHHPRPLVREGLPSPERTSD